MKILSCFDGISACQVALKNLGIEYDYYASEIDHYAIKVTQINFPNTVQLGDVKSFNGKDFYKDIAYQKNENRGGHKYDLAFDILYQDKWNGELPKDYIQRNNLNTDILIGGSPCQDLSIAKKDRKGLDGERSGLFFEYVRILNEVKPKFFILENVASASKDVIKEMTSHLYGIEPIVINSALLTAQQRKRVYFAGALQTDGTYKKVEIEQPQDKEILLKDILESGLPYQEKAHSLTASYSGAVFWNSIKKKQRSMIAEPIRLGHFNKGGQGDRIYSIQGKSVCLSANGGGRGALTGLYKIDLPDGDYNIRKLTVNECCRLQGFPDGFVDSISKSQGYKALGNSFTIPVIEHILKTIFKINA